MKLPVVYNDLNWKQRQKVRAEYIKIQNEKCMYCGESIWNEAPMHIKTKEINWSLFPPNFLKYPIHLQHNHDTGLTEGVVHNYCNAVMWQYEGE